MKFDIEGLELSETISKYIKNEDYLEVKFLDGTSEYIVLEDENMVKNIQREQALEFIKGYDPNSEKLVNRISVALLATISSLTAVVGYNTIIYLLKTIKEDSNFAFGTTLCAFLTYVGIETINVGTKIYDALIEYPSDQKKYLLFFENEEMINKYTKNFDLNSIDDIEIRQLKQLVRKLNKIDGKE